MHPFSVGIFTRTLTAVPTRRDILRGLAAAGLGLGVARLPQIAAAKKKRKKQVKVQRNSYGCVSVGDACRNDGQCCSGICGGGRCRTRGTGTCSQIAEGFCADDTPTPDACGASSPCYCFRTTAESNFCGAPVFIPAACGRDADCAEQGFPAGSGCVPIGAGNCFGDFAFDTACVPPCGSPIPGIAES